MISTLDSHSSTMVSKKKIVRTRLSVYLKVAALGVTTNLRSDLERMKLGEGDDLTTF